MDQQERMEPQTPVVKPETKRAPHDPNELLMDDEELHNEDDDIDS
jgi:hypothetical protein